MRETRLGMTLLAGVACLAVGGQAVAAGYPERPVRMIVANAPGSTSDTFGRIVFSRMSEAFGQQIVVDNRAGAGGVIGAEITARANPDGYTLGAFTAAVLTIAPHVQRKVPYHPLKSFAPVSLFVRTQTALCVTAALPARNIREFIALGKERKGGMQLASAGVGSTSHLGGLLFATMAGVETNHVPYKGGGPAMAAVVQGEAQWILGPLGTGMSHVKAGRLRCLATGGDSRSIAAPELPTIAESGLPQFQYYGWNGVLAPAGVPRAIIDRLNAAMRKALEGDDLRQRYLALGETPGYTTVAEFAALIRSDYDAMGAIVRRAGITAQ
jgi:tripartite-type tricarboxylate transporter receptor subunit TctC